MYKNMRQSNLVTAGKIALGGLSWASIDWLSFTILKKKKIEYIPKNQFAEELLEINPQFRTDQQLKNTQNSFSINFLYGSFAVTLGKIAFRSFLIKQHFLIKCTVMAPCSIVSYYIFCNLLQQKQPFQNMFDHFGILLAVKVINISLLESHSQYVKNNIQNGIDLLNKGKLHITLHRRIQFFGALDILMRFGWIFLLNSLYNDRKDKNY